MDSTEDDSTPAQRIGIIVHRALLEPDTFKNGFHVRPKGLQFTTVEGKAWKIGHQDRPIISFDEATMIEKMVSSVHTHPFAKKLLLNAETERSIFVEDENGIMRKMRLDALTAGTTMPDIKTCENASDKWIERQISQFRYHVQAAFYLDNMKLIGIEKRQWFFVCCEKSPPYAVRCLQLIGDVIDYGKMLYQRDLQVYRTCLETGTWPAWSNGFDQIGLPSYEMRALEQMG